MKKLLEEKCKNVKVDLDLNKIFTNLDDLEKLWKHHLVELVERLPDFDKVIVELKKLINKMD